MVLLATLVGLLVAQLSFCERQWPVNRQAADLTCSGVEDRPSLLNVMTHIHPMYEEFVVKVMCGGHLQHANRYLVPFNLSIWYDSEHGSECGMTLMEDGNLSLVIVIEMHTEVIDTLTFMCLRPSTLNFVESAQMFAQRSLIDDNDSLLRNIIRSVPDPASQVVPDDVVRGRNVLRSTVVQMPQTITIESTKRSSKFLIVENISSLSGINATNDDLFLSTSTFGSYRPQSFNQNVSTSSEPNGILSFPIGSLLAGALATLVKIAVPDAEPRNDYKYGVVHHLLNNWRSTLVDTVETVPDRNKDDHNKEDDHNVNSRGQAILTIVDRDILGTMLASKADICPIYSWYIVAFSVWLIVIVHL